jgi:glycine/D-amino acid oxidase-like deaminating enzyme
VVTLLFVADDISIKTAHVRDAKGGFSFPAGHLWPYKLITSLIRIAIDHGLNLQTYTPVSEIADAPTADGFWPVTTSRGVIQARKIIFATNAYTSALAPQYAKAIVPCKGVCTQIAAAPGAPHQLLTGTYAIRLGPGAFIYQITRNDGSLIVGGASHTFKNDIEQWHNNFDDSKLIDVGVDFFDGYMQRTFLGWEDSGAEVKHVWSGGMYTRPVAFIPNCADLILCNIQLWDTVQTRCPMLEVSLESRDSSSRPASMATACLSHSFPAKLLPKWH